ncbi:ATP-binding protein [Robertmurraya sp. 2P01SA]|uniref:ATP-binding protein n=2 Tax=Robertmurraya TaxID=2837507 RepID=UPI0039A64829
MNIELKQLYNRLKKPKEKKYIKLPTPSFNVSFSKLMQQTKRGFLAQKIGEYLGMDTKESEMLYDWSTKIKASSFSNYQNQMEFILYLSEQMLDWNNQQEDITEKVKSLDIDINIQNAMLKAYEIHKQELFSAASSPTCKPKIDSDSHLEQDRWTIYREVMFAATQGQFLLINEEEMNHYRVGNILCEGTIKKSSDIPLCRNLVQELLEKIGLPKSKVMSSLLVLSEAMTNTIKHAEEGKMTLIVDQQKNEMCFVIEDRGPGFSLKDLPKKVLLEGYSTKRSMGQGFTIMRKMAKQILLCTTPRGSTIILIFDIREGNARGDVKLVDF